MPAGNVEVKGKQNLRRYLFRLEDKGIKSNELNLVRDIIGHMESLGTKLFASIVFAEEELDLCCADENRLERPFYFLFERIDLFMKENHPGLMDRIIFDDRGIETNKRISASVSNFFHKCSVGQRFSNIIKVPSFAISTENVGIQMADITAYILSSRFTGNRAQKEFFQRIKTMEFESREKILVGGSLYPRKGFKVVKKKEAGDLFDPGRI